METAAIIAVIINFIISVSSYLYCKKVESPQLKAYFEFKKFVEEMDWHDTGEISDEDAIAEEILKR